MVTEFNISEKIFKSTTVSPDAYSNALSAQSLSRVSVVCSWITKISVTAAVMLLVIAFISLAYSNAKSRGERKTQCVYAIISLFGVFAATSIAFVAQCIGQFSVVW